MLQIFLLTTFLQDEQEEERHFFSESWANAVFEY